MTLRLTQKPPRKRQRALPLPIREARECVEDGCTRSVYEDDRCKKHRDLFEYRLARALDVDHQ